MGLKLLRYYEQSLCSSIDSLSVAPCVCVLNVDIFKRLDLHWSMYAHACSDNPQVVIKIAPTFPPERLRSFAHNVTGDFSTLLSSRLVFDNEGGCARWRRPTKLEKVFGVPHKGHYWSRTA